MNCGTNAQGCPVSNFVGMVGGKPKTPIHRYRFPPQETELRGGEELKSVGGANLGTVEAISIRDGTIDIKKRKDTADVHPEAVFAHKVVRCPEQQNALVRIGEYVADHGMDGDGPYLAARDLLLRAPPRLGGAAIRQPDGDDTPSRSPAVRPSGRRHSANPRTARRGQDLHWRPDDLRACPPGQDRRHHGEQPQGHPQPDRRDDQGGR